MLFFLMDNQRWLISMLNISFFIYFILIGCQLILLYFRLEPPHVDYRDSNSIRAGYLYVISNKHTLIKILGKMSVLCLLVAISDKLWSINKQHTMFFVMSLSSFFVGLWMVYGYAVLLRSYHEFNKKYPVNMETLRDKS